MTPTYFCENALEVYPTGPSKTGIIMLIIGLIYLFESLIIIFWIKQQEKASKKGDNDAVKSVIFPVFTKVLWINAVINVYIGLVMILLVPPSRGYSSNNWEPVIAYTMMCGVQHTVIEGVAFLLMQKGLGIRAAKNALQLSIIWGLITMLLKIILLSVGGIVGFVAEFTWNSMVLAFYGLLLWAPAHRLFRRPAVFFYAKFWFGFRLLSMVAEVLQYWSYTNAVGACSFTFGPLLLFALCEPFVMFHTLLLDSFWWQGLQINAKGQRHGGEINSLEFSSPLKGCDIKLSSAQSLATTMDSIGSGFNAVRLLNFAHIILHTDKLLGQGSFSKVYRYVYMFFLLLKVLQLLCCFHECICALCIYRCDVEILV